MSEVYWIIRCRHATPVSCDKRCGSRVRTAGHPFFRLEEQMELRDLLARSGEFPVDKIEGRIVQIDGVKPQPSQFGPPQKVQDVVFEASDRQRYVVAFYDLNIRCFTNEYHDGDKPMHFEKGIHEGFWVSLQNTGKEAKKATLKKLSRDHKASKHWAGKGAQVVIKATGTVDAFWLLPEGAEWPPMGETTNIKRSQDLRPPGRRPPDRSGGDPAQPPQQQAQNQEPHQETPVVDPTELVDRMAWLASTTLKCLEAAYAKAQDLTIPKGDELLRVMSTIMIAVKMKTNVIAEDQEHLKKCCWVLAQFYVKQHEAVLRELDNDLIRDERLLSTVTTCFIESSRDLRMPRKESSRQQTDRGNSPQGGRENSRRDGRRDDRRR
jgi:hypothetical protein